MDKEKLAKLQAQVRIGTSAESLFLMSCAPSHARHMANRKLVVRDWKIDADALLQVERAHLDGSRSKNQPLQLREMTGNCKLR